MKKIFQCLLVLFITTFSFSQDELSKDYTYSVSESYKVIYERQKFYFSKENESLSIKFDEKKVMIQKFDSDKPAFLGEKYYENYFPANYRVESVLELNTKFYVFYSSWNGDADKEQLFAQEINFDKGEFLNQPKLIIQVEGKISGGSSFSFFGGGGLKSMIEGTQDKFDFLCSHNKKSLLIQYIKKPEIRNDKKSYSTIGLFTFDYNLKQVSEKEIKMPYSEKLMENLDYQLDNDGNLYLLARVFNEDKKDNNKKNSVNYHIELFFIKNDSNEIKISKISNKDKFISKLWLFDSPHNFLVSGGFYGDANEEDKVNGVLAFKIDKNGDIYDEAYHEIPLEIINQNLSKKELKGNSKLIEKGVTPGVPNLFLNHLIVNQDGSLVLIGEQFYVTSGVSANGGNYSNTHFDDILICKININGGLSWIKKIAKEQFGGSRIGGLSFKYLESNNYHYLIYLDNIKNINLPDESEPEIYKDANEGFLTAVKISDFDGSFSKTSILNPRNVNNFRMRYFAIDRVFKTSSNSFMFEVFKQPKEDVMIKVNLN